MVTTELLTVNQVAERLQIQPRTVQTWARQGRIPTVKLSAKVVRFDWRAVLDSLQQQQQPAEVLATDRRKNRGQLPVGAEEAQR